VIVLVSVSEWDMVSVGHDRKEGHHFRANDLEIKGN